eukprot:CAMPEP_0172167962 /NCGR_PEP_ID=MMETSP1050-20130122/9865_1 /TAXON_ID=233186 /ORGANISM="Cryptomonas curvata, Strain CCAP979/52" /LENGTH=400 /DNA_ID=CAMNT_0012838815 /DNA_START=446 /DNA_END=1644 /DNA_ORIENTATION=+
MNCAVQASAAAVYTSLNVSRPVLIDIRQYKEYIKGHAGGSINNPALEEVNGTFDLQTETFMHNVALQHPQRDEPLVLLGGSEALLSAASSWLCQAQYINVTVVLNGFAEWKKAGFPTSESADCFVSRSAEQVFELLHLLADISLIDFRPSPESVKGYTLGSVSVSPVTYNGEVDSRMFLNSVSVFHPNKSAPVVLIGDNRTDVEEAAAWLCGAGYTNLTMVRGGFEGWVQDGLSAWLFPDNGCPANASAAQAHSLVSRVAEALLIDVRTSTQYRGAGGYPAGAVNVPVLGNDRKDAFLAAVAEEQPDPHAVVVLIGASGTWNADTAGRWLCAAGYTNVTVAAAARGFAEWKARGLPVADAARSGCAVNRTAAEAQALLGGAAEAMLIDVRAGADFAAAGA